MRYSSTLSSTSALEGGGWWRPRPVALAPGKPIGDCLGPTACLNGAENLAPAGIRSSDRTARSESLYRLSCPGPLLILCLYLYTNFRRLVWRLKSKWLINFHRLIWSTLVAAWCQSSHTSYANIYAMVHSTTSRTSSHQRCCCPLSAFTVVREPVSPHILRTFWNVFRCGTTSCS